MYKKYFKRLTDIILSAAALIILSPVLLAVAVLVKIKLGSPVIFKQQRPGKDEKIFTMYKFRTMTNDKDENGRLLPDDLRLTKFGKFLRNLSLDELPELLNIIKGDMSVVGPRPLLVEYLPLYNEVQKHRHDVKPGLTGLAQVNGRNMVGWDDRFTYDITYIHNLTLKQDIKIIWQTLKIIVKKTGISSVHSATMENFKNETVTVIGVVVNVNDYDSLNMNSSIKKAGDLDDKLAT